jgi:hypothetical protein
MKILPFILLVALTSCSHPESRTQNIVQQVQAGVQQVQTGNLILRAIEQYDVETRSYPASLTNFVPSYLPRYLAVTTNANFFLTGWDYRLATNGSHHATFRLRYNMEGGAIEYRSAPAEWVQEIVLEKYK